MMTLRPYQEKAIVSVNDGWPKWQRQLGVAATGAGKTIIFSHLASQEKGRTLILAHREELISQAVSKLHSSTGIFASVEQGSQRAMPGHGCIVGSVQSMKRRLKKYAPTTFDLVICDEAHHALSTEWQEVLTHFSSARVLGVTATPDRSDRRALGQYFQGVAFEVGLLELIAEQYLCPLRALRLPVELDTRHLRLKRGGEISTNDAAELITPQLRELAAATAAEIWDRKALIFLPRCDVSEAFAAALCSAGIDARHVAGTSDDREGQLGWFEKSGRGTALCNAMLLTEGYDRPDIDCIVCLRPTRSRSLYAQIVGRGTRISPGKEFCLLLDPLWISGTIDLCKPADLIASNQLHRDKLQARIDEGLDISAAEVIAKEDVEKALAESLLEAQKNRKAPAGLVDPLAWSVGIHDSDLETYEPTMPWEEEQPTEAQMAELKEWGVWTERVTRGFATVLLERIKLRESMGLASPKQVMKLRQLGHANPDLVTAGQAGMWMRQRISHFQRAA
jgi:superfamily II DNA or RNA helicase